KTMWRRSFDLHGLAHAFEHAPQRTLPEFTAPSTLEDMRCRIRLRTALDGIEDGHSRTAERAIEVLSHLHFLFGDAPHGAACSAPVDLAPLSAADGTRPEPRQD